MNSSKQIKLGAILSYLSIAVNIIAGLIYTPWMLDQIGESDYGLYTLSNSLITLFLVDFGLGSAVSRYVSKYRAEGNEEKVNNFLGIVYKLYLIIDAIIFAVLLIVFFLIDRIYIKLTPEELEKFKIIYVISASFAVFNFPFVTFNGILTSYEKFIQQKLVDVIYRVQIVCLTVVALIMGYGLYALVVVHAIVGLLTILFKFICIKSSIPIKVNFKYWDKGLCKEIFGFSIWVTISSLAQRLIFNITPTVLGVVASSSAIAIFGVITTMEGYTYTITSAINGMFLPKISRIYARSDSENDLTPMLLKVGKFQYALNGLIIVGFAVVGKEFIELWMSNNDMWTYSDSLDAYYGILLVIIPGLFYNALQIANTAMIVENKVRLQASINIITGLINIILSFITSYFFGVVGASFSIFIAYMFRAIAINIVSQKKLGLNIGLFIKECYIKMSIPIIASCAVGVLINMLIADQGWFTLIIKGCLIVVVYVSLMYTIGLNKNDRSLIKDQIGSILKKK